MGSEELWWNLQSNNNVGRHRIPFYYPLLQKRNYLHEVLLRRGGAWRNQSRGEKLTLQEQVYQLQLVFLIFVQE